MHQRPSDLIDLNDPYTRWCFDEVVLWFYDYIEGEVAKVKHDDHEKQEVRQQAKREYLLGLRSRAAMFRPIGEPVKR